MCRFFFQQVQALCMKTSLLKIQSCIQRRSPRGQIGQSWKCVTAQTLPAGFYFQQRKQPHHLLVGNSLPDNIPAIVCHLHYPIRKETISHYVKSMLFSLLQRQHENSSASLTEPRYTVYRFRKYQL